MAPDDLDAYHERYTFTMGRPNFILQHVVDANMAQRMDGTGPPIGAVFALAGLHPHAKKGLQRRARSTGAQDHGHAASSAPKPKACLLTLTQRDP